MTVSSHHHSSSAGWQLLGVTEVSVGVDAQAHIHAYLTEALVPLRLHPEFLDKVLVSAQASIEHALEPNGEISFGHIHLSIFAPVERSVKNSTWGFFRVEKIGGPASSSGHPDHMVEFYLYLEGS